MTDRERRYVVTGIHPVLGHKPGTAFTAAIPPDQEAALITGGGIRRVSAPRASRVSLSKEKQK